MGLDGTDHERALETVYNRTINVDFQYIRAIAITCTWESTWILKP